MAQNKLKDFVEKLLISVDVKIDDNRPSDIKVHDGSVAQIK